MDVFVLPQRLAACVLLGFVCAASAQSATPTDAPLAPSYRWRIELSPHTSHYSYNPEHRPVHLVGLEREASDNSFYGMALFSNSFGQDSTYVYAGQSFYGVFESLPKVYLKVSAGILYGYKPPYENKVPLNYKGFSPAIVPAVGWRFDSGWAAQMNFLGTAGVMYSVVKEF
nr:hypothetical protein [uncultured Albidiferax sp.]